MRVLGCLAYYKNVKPANKVAPRAFRALNLGIAEDQPGYVLYDLENAKVVVTPHVRFCETVYPGFSKKPGKGEPTLDEVWPPFDSARGDSCRERAQPRDGRGCEERWCWDAGSAACWCWERAQPRVVGAREAVASVLGRPGRTGQGAPVLPASLECARCSVQPPPAQRRLRAHVRAALPSGSQADLRGPTAV